MFETVCYISGVFLVGLLVGLLVSRWKNPPIEPYAFFGDVAWVGPGNSHQKEIDGIVFLYDRYGRCLGTVSKDIFIVKSGEKED
jgi:hypothetical protein